MAKKSIVAKKTTRKPVKKAIAVANKKLPAATKPYNKTEIVTKISELVKTITKKQASDTLDALSKILEAHLKKGAAGVFTLPGVMKCYILHKPATKAHKGINPFTKEEMMFKAKPARNIVRIRPLKKLKDVV